MGSMTTLSQGKKEKWASFTVPFVISARKQFQNILEVEILFLYS